MGSSTSRDNDWSETALASARVPEIGLLFQRILAEEPELAGQFRFSEVGSLIQGDAALSHGQWDEAVECFQRSYQSDPDSAETGCALGIVFLTWGQPHDAAICFMRAIRIKPDFARAYSNLGNAFLLLDRLEESRDAYRQALAIKPDYPEACCNLGGVYRALGDLDKAVELYRQAISLKDDCLEAYHNLGNVFREQGRMDEAIACFRQALAIRPTCIEANNGLVFTLDLMAIDDVRVLQDERRRWGDSCVEQNLTHEPFANGVDANRRLRIGYVSADFRSHSASVGFGAMLMQFDRGRFEVFAYSSGIAADSLTDVFRRNVTCWRDIYGLSDDRVAGLIREDGIDILVDLSGHSAGNRLLVFAKKPAPIQVTGWGYAGGTGLRTMDAMFSDAVVTPPEECEFFVEEVRYLPSAIGGFFFDPFPECTGLPALSKTHRQNGMLKRLLVLFGAGALDEVGRKGKKNESGIVFGSLNRLVKISAGVIVAWAEVLRKLPSSRLLLKAGEFDHEKARLRIMDQFEKEGVDSHRLILVGQSSQYDHRSAFNRIDIALDTFPQSGGVTTLEGLMMGVPVVTLRGRSFVGRGSASILTTLGLEDWIAESEEAYVEIAVRKAGDLRGLAELRGQLRYRLQESIIGDTEAYVKEVEKEYRTLWREWCARQVKEG